MNKLPLTKQADIVRALVEGNSIRGTARMTGADRETVMFLGGNVGVGCAMFERAMIGNVPVHRAELDEIWTYVGKKQRHVDYSVDPWFVGDQYTFVALDSRSKLVVSYLTGKRNAENTQKFCFDFASRCRTGIRPTVLTDGWDDYANSLRDAFHGDVDHGVVVKNFQSTAPSDAPAARRYSPGRVVAIKKFIATGDVAEDDISTSYVERQNLTIRMSMRRFVRLTNGFSKKFENLCAAVALHFAHYNFCRLHEAHRVTPAMAAGIADHVWSVEELIDTAMTLPIAADPFGHDREVAA